MHKRRAFLETLKTALKTLPNFAGVAIQRVPPARCAYPYITIAAEGEGVDTLTVHGQPRPQDRKLSIGVKVWIKGTPDDGKAELDMDTTALAIEAVMARPTGADDLELVATDFQVSEEEMEIHLLTLTYVLKYTTTEFNPT